MIAFENELHILYPDFKVGGLLLDGTEVVIRRDPGDGGDMFDIAINDIDTYSCFYTNPDERGAILRILHENGRTRIAETPDSECRLNILKAESQRGAKRRKLYQETPLRNVID